MSHVEELTFSTYTAEGPYDIPPRWSTEDRDKFHKSLLVTDQFGQAQTARLWEEYLLPKYPDSPFLLLRIGDVRRAFGSLALACEAYESAQRLEGIGADPVFDFFLTAFRKRCDQAEEDQMFAWADHAFAHYWNPIQAIAFPPSSEPPKELVDDMRSRWQRIKSPHTTKMANGFNHRSKSYQVEPENYYRLFALETNSIENIPQFPKEVIPEVLRNGFHADAVISSVPSEVVNYTTSSLTKEAVATVLNDSVAAIRSVVKIAEIDQPYDVAKLCSLHEKCMERSRFRTTFSKLPNGSLVNVRTKYLPTGRTRGASRTNVTMNAFSGSIQFCPFEEVDGEIETFVRTAEEYRKKHANQPFAMAAWINYAFITLHPFQDGNGSMARLLASTPLIKAGLPPLCIPTTLKSKYVAALDHLRSAEWEDSRYDPLISVFSQGIQESLKTVENLAV